MNIKVVLEYDGTEFSGWQHQSGRRTVEGELRRALRQLTGQDVKVYAAGRTDAGTHALGQVVNFHLDSGPPLKRLADALNGVLPRDVSALSAQAVDDGFHARYSARWRRYRYRYLDRRARPALDRQQCWWVREPLDVVAMEAAAPAGLLRPPQDLGALVPHPVLDIPLSTGVPAGPPGPLGFSRRSR